MRGRRAGPAHRSALGRVGNTMEEYHRHCEEVSPLCRLRATPAPARLSAWLSAVCSPSPRRPRELGASPPGPGFTPPVSVPPTPRPGGWAERPGWPGQSEAIGVGGGAGSRAGKPDSGCVRWGWVAGHRHLLGQALQTLCPLASPK